MSYRTWARRSIEMNAADACGTAADGAMRVSTDAPIASVRKAPEPAARRNKPIRIAFLIDRIDYEFGGTERQLVLLLRHLDRERFEPTLCCLQDSPWLHDHRELCATYVLGFRSFFRPGDWVRIARFAGFLRRSGIDILQTHFRDGNIVGTIAGRLAGTHCIVATRRNLGYWHSRRELAVVRWLNPWVTHFIANARAIQDYVCDVERVPPGRVTVIYNGLELAQFARPALAERASCKERLGIDPSAPLVVSVANLRPVKGVDVFVRAAAWVAAREPRARFVAVGDGPDRDALTALAAELGIGERIAFLGQRRDVAEILAAADVGVLSSHSEGLSNALIEYMAAGLPAVCTDVGGNRELVTHGQNGRLVPPADPQAMGMAILELLRDPQAAARMGEVARRRMEAMFGVQRYVDETQAYYERIAA